MLRLTAPALAVACALGTAHADGYYYSESVGFATAELAPPLPLGTVGLAVVRTAVSGGLANPGGRGESPRSVGVRKTDSAPGPFGPKTSSAGSGAAAEDETGTAAVGD